MAMNAVVFTKEKQKRGKAAAAKVQRAMRAAGEKIKQKPLMYGDVKANAHIPTVRFGSEARDALGALEATWGGPRMSVDGHE